MLVGRLEGAPVSDDETLTPELEALLRAERDAPGPTPELRARVAARLGATLGVSLSPTVAHPSPPHPSSPPPPPASAAASGSHVAASAAGKSIAVKLAATALAGALAGGGALTARWLWLRPAHRATTSVVAPPVAPSAPAQSAPATPAPFAPATLAPSVPATPAPSAPTLASPAAAPPVPAPPPAAAPAPPPPRHPAGDLSAERALLADARAALQAGDAARALAQLERHATRFRHGELSEERDALRVRALWLAGDHDEARRRAGAFARRYPDSLFLPSVRALVTDSPESPQ